MKHLLKTIFLMVCVLFAAETINAQVCKNADRYPPMRYGPYLMGAARTVKYATNITDVQKREWAVRYSQIMDSYLQTMDNLVVIMKLRGDTWEKVCSDMGTQLQGMNTRMNDYIKQAYAATTGITNYKTYVDGDLVSILKYIQASTLDRNALVASMRMTSWQDIAKP